MTQPIRFEELPLSKELLRAIEDMGFEEASPIQASAIPPLMAGRDVIGQAQTGTGKTAAFAIPALEAIDPRSPKTQVLVLCPTRELAIQAAEEVATLGRRKRGVQALPVYGGQPIDRQIKGLRKGAQAVIGTPGRIIDHLERGTLNLDDVKLLVLDEADVMLDMGFRDDIERILKSARPERQTALFSATMPPSILELARTYLRDPEIIRTTPKEVAAPNIEQIWFEAPKPRKIEALTRVIDIYDPRLALIFCNTKRMVDELTEHLQTRGYLADALHGDMSQSQRDRVMGKFRGGAIEVLVATDVAARGLDVEDVEAVVNYDIPNDVETYVHRIGRTGRAGRSGRAFTFVSGREFYKLRDIMKFAKVKIEQRRVPSSRDVEEAKTGLFLTRVREIIEQGELDRYVRIVEGFLEEDVSSLDMAAALLKLTLGGDRTGREEATEQQGRPPAAGPSFGDTGAERGMVRLFLNVGRKHKVGVGDIVGAIAGETGMPGRSIGAVEMYEGFSFVEVPEDYARQVLDVMNDNQIRGNRVFMEPATKK